MLGEHVVCQPGIGSGNFYFCMICWKLLQNLRIFCKKGTDYNGMNQVSIPSIALLEINIWGNSVKKQLLKAKAV